MKNSKTTSKSKAGSKSVKKLFDIDSLFSVPKRLAKEFRKAYAPSPFKKFSQQDINKIRLELDRTCRDGCADILKDHSMLPASRDRYKDIFLNVHLQLVGGDIFYDPKIIETMARAAGRFADACVAEDDHALLLRRKSASMKPPKPMVKLAPKSKKNEKR